MLELLIIIILATYLGLFLANILKLNTAGVLYGRVFFAAIIPIIHFIIVPFGILFKGLRDGMFFKVLLLIPQYFLIYPVVLAQYAATVKPLNERQKNVVKVKQDIDDYESVSEDMLLSPC
ncbi:hypothetical protein [Veillonella parvula]|uniref:hypothetical protein n=1 Tax=Veillonella parvula TaxID=29466 RepID=UPI0028FE60BD|nr:hypothetical protein [Veillonella parvula]MDU3190504.1 hypothetical protein [Veillonella parvula]MDU6072981.1 hypothetical protein [Veillonella parvula]